MLKTTHTNCGADYHRRIVLFGQRLYADTAVMDRNPKPVADIRLLPIPVYHGQFPAAVSHWLFGVDHN